MFSNAAVVKTVKTKPNKSFKETSKAGRAGTQRKASAKRQWQAN